MKDSDKTNPEIVHEETLTMGIHEVVNQALTTGYLSIEAENRLRQLLQTTHYGVDEMNAFVDLQLAAMAGNIRQESREKLQKKRDSECALSCSVR